MSTTVMQPSATELPATTRSTPDLLPSTKAVINYLSRDVENPYFYITKPDNDEPVTNQVSYSPTVDIADIRGLTEEQRRQAGFTVDEAGFQLVEGFGKRETAQEWADRKWEDESWIESVYYNDIDQLFKEKLGVTSTFIFDHTVRKRRTKETENLPDDPDNRTPVARAHSDQSRWAGENRILKHLGKETLERVKRGELHAQLINIWRPLRGEAWDTPLAVADSRTVRSGGDGNPPDWRVCELRYPTWTGETLAVSGAANVGGGAGEVWQNSWPESPVLMLFLLPCRFRVAYCHFQIHYNPNHRWYYYSGLPADKAILLKCYDSVTETRTPHTAFEDPLTPADAEPRWSIEARVLAITDPSLKE
nr:7alpha-cephem-methoxylase p8 chain-like protein [Thecaphora frezii]